MSATYAIPMTGLIPREFSFEDTARIMINDEMLNIIVLMYSESHVDNVEVTNMLSDSVSMYAYGAMPISIALSGLVKEAKDGNHLYSVLKKYKTEWRQRLLTDYKKNTKLTIMDVVMDFAITSINIVKNTDIMGYDTINIDGIGWNYTMPQDNLFKYSGDGLDGEEAAATNDTSTTNTPDTSSAASTTNTPDTSSTATSSGSSTESETSASQSAQDLNTQTEKEEKKSEDQTPTKVMYKKEEEKQEDAPVEAKVEQYSKEDNYKLLNEHISVTNENGIAEGSVTRTYVYNGKKITETTPCTTEDLINSLAKSEAMAEASTSSEKQAIQQQFFDDWQLTQQATNGKSASKVASAKELNNYLDDKIKIAKRSINRKKQQRAVQVQAQTNNTIHTGN